MHFVNVAKLFSKRNIPIYTFISSIWTYPSSPKVDSNFALSFDHTHALGFFFLKEQESLFNITWMITCCFVQGLPWSDLWKLKAKRLILSGRVGSNDKHKRCSPPRVYKFEKNLCSRSERSDSHPLDIGLGLCCQRSPLPAWWGNSREHQDSFIPHTFSDS